MRIFMGLLKIGVVSLCLFLFSIATTWAVPIKGYNGNEGWASFDGTFAFSFESDEAARIDVSLTNTTPEAYGGYLTAFAFLFPEDATYTNITFDSNNDNFSLMDGEIKAEPYNDFDLGGSSTGGQWLGGGDPNDGIAIGFTSTFEFILTGSGFESLTTDSFINAGNPWFAARFRGGEDDLSDKVPAQVPEPATMLLLGVGLIGIAAMRRRKGDR